MKRICVFCGSSPGRQPEYTNAAEETARMLVQYNLGLVYGGARVGTMGTLADTILAEGGDVIGVMPRLLVDKEVTHEELDDLRIVGSMHERKQLMADLADGFIAMPGGMGTFEEFFEILTWAQLGMHNKPCGLLNTCGYYDALIGFLDHAVAEQFIKPAHRSMILIQDNPETLIRTFKSHSSPTVSKWGNER
ncbi:MAG: TIGR00730 family Rossman fold protein [Thermodesulfobacteriota bacterium]|nr:TIGR00730 family Rossman fold protein [Thermodesulfobacteriota bacterium]